jgi:hypothetical protein
VKRKAKYILAAGAIALVAVIIFFWRYPQNIYTTTMMDGVGGPGLGFGKRGIGQSVWEWKSWNGSEVVETAISYSTFDDARKDFEEELQTVNTIYQQSGAGNHRRVVAQFHPGHTVTVVTLNGSEIRHADAGSLEGALMFDRSWLKFPY